MCFHMLLCSLWTLQPCSGSAENPVYLSSLVAMSRKLQTEINISVGCNRRSCLLALHRHPVWVIWRIASYLLNAICIGGTSAPLFDPLWVHRHNPWSECYENMFCELTIKRSIRSHSQIINLISGCWDTDCSPLSYTIIRKKPYIYV